jgi:uncharacterized protein involved in exopolysaccharide biosynthesis
MFDYLIVVTRWRKFIAVTVVGTAIIAAGVSLLMANRYEATARLLPPKDQNALNPFGAASSVLKGIGGGKLGGLGQNTGAYNYLAILSSRSALEAVVQKFDLINVYDAPQHSMDRAVKELEGNVSCELEKDDYVSVTVIDKDQQRAADMANFFVELLNTISNRLATQEARSNREFIEKRLGEVRTDLATAEDSLSHYQVASGMIITPEESATASGISSLYAMKVRKEIEYAIMQRTMGGDNPELHQTEIELRELQRKTAAIPGAGIQSLRLYRNLLIQQKIMEFLVPLYEQAKIDEHKDVPVILVLDKASPPEKKSQPKRTFIVLLATCAALAFSLVLVFLRERVAESLKDEEQAAKLAWIRQNLYFRRRKKSE